MRLVLSWLREFVDVDASAQQIADTLGLRGFEVAALEALADGDAVIDFEITANRPDCLSVIGLAREVATLYDLPLKALDAGTPKGEADEVGPPEGGPHAKSALQPDKGGVRLQPD